MPLRIECGQHGCQSDHVISLPWIASKKSGHNVGKGQHEQHQARQFDRGRSCQAGGGGLRVGRHVSQATIKDETGTKKGTKKAAKGCLGSYPNWKAIRYE